MCSEQVNRSHPCSTSFTEVFDHAAGGRLGRGLDRGKADQSKLDATIIRAIINCQEVEISGKRGGLGLRTDAAYMYRIHNTLIIR